MTWMEDAACREYDSGLWFPYRGRYDMARQAVAVCNSCPVVAECLRHAATLRVRAGMSLHGIWAGRVMDKLTVTEAKLILGAAS